MTIDAVTNDAGVIESGRQPGDRTVAVITGISTVDVRWVFARGGDAIVAGATSANDLGVINRVRWNPQRAVMAVLTNIGGLYVGHGLAGGGRAIVTTAAISDDTSVIKGGR